MKKRCYHAFDTKIEQSVLELRGDVHEMTMLTCEIRTPIEVDWVLIPAIEVFIHLHDNLAKRRYWKLFWKFPVLQETVQIGFAGRALGKGGIIGFQACTCIESWRSRILFFNGLVYKLLWHRLAGQQNFNRQMGKNCSCLIPICQAVSVKECEHGPSILPCADVNIQHSWL